MEEIIPPASRADADYACLDVSKALAAAGVRVLADDQFLAADRWSSLSLSCSDHDSSSGNVIREEFFHILLKY